MLCWTVVSDWQICDTQALSNTLLLWRFGIVRSQRHWSPGSYLSTSVALPTVRLKWHPSKVEQKKTEVRSWPLLVWGFEAQGGQVLLFGACQFRMQATEWHLSCAHDNKRFEWSCSEG